MQYEVDEEKIRARFAEEQRVDTKLKPYDELGVFYDEEKNVIKRCYLRLMAIVHPDHHSEELRKMPGYNGVAEKVCLS